MTSKMKVSGQSPARTEMIEVMAMKGLARRTQENCLASVCSLARHWGRAPQALSADGVRSWVVGRIERGLSPRTTNAGISALRLFLADAMGQPGKVQGLRSRRIPDSLPRSIPEADVERLVQGIKDLRGDPDRLRRRPPDRGGGGASDRRRQERGRTAPDPQRQGRPRAHGPSARPGARRAGTLLEQDPAAPLKLAVLPVQSGPADHRPEPAQGLQREPRPSGARPRRHLPLPASRGWNAPA